MKTISDSGLGIGNNDVLPTPKTDKEKEMILNQAIKEMSTMVKL